MWVDDLVVGKRAKKRSPHLQKVETYTSREENRPMRCGGRRSALERGRPQSSAPHRPPDSVSIPLRHYENDLCATSAPIPCGVPSAMTSSGRRPACSTHACRLDKGCTFPC